MIGVIAREREMDAVREFFELFKTPWESWSSENSYDAVLCTTGEIPSELHAQLLILYSGSKLASDSEAAVEEPRSRTARILCYNDNEIPIYGNCVTFPRPEKCILAERDSRRTAVRRQRQGEREEVLRVGYDLFEEVRFLLTRGQPVEYAGIPTLELHIAFLREQMSAAGIEVVEIPPVPEGYRFIVCLTHDVDHPALRKHRCDHTAGGFLYRGTIGALLRFLRGRSSLSELMRNWIAVIKWPFVQVGLAKDFWADFFEQYRKIEAGVRSTYFVIPFAGRPGRAIGGATAKRRAAGYGARDIEPAIRNILRSGNEIGLHGIDAWIDSEAGLQEVEEIRSITGQPKIGIRSHWLLHEEQSPRRLERVGASYDSTIGYRETVGYRAGTTQAYKPFGVESLMEMPLHVMDTALFYPAYLGLTMTEANEILAKLMSNAERFGGCLTVNWHDRSLAPERQWSACYRELLEELRSRGSWFASCGEAAAWFRTRRSVIFERDADDGKTMRARATASTGQLPNLVLRKESQRRPVTMGKVDAVQVADLPPDDSAANKMHLEQSA